jgi:hypothetical protein
MATRARTDVALEMEVVVKLAPAERVSRDLLEEATMEVQRALDEHTLDIADGAVASANFIDGSIEIDALLDGGSVAEIHQALALMVTRLERYCQVPIGTFHGTPGSAPSMTVRSSGTQLVGA